MRFALTPYLLLAVSAVVYARPLTWNVVDPVSHLDPRSPPVPGTGTPPPRERVVTLPQIMVTPPPSVTLVITFTGEAANGVTAGIPSSEDTPLGVPRIVTARLEEWGKSRFNAPEAIIQYEADENGKGDAWMLKSALGGFTFLYSRDGETEKHSAKLPVLVHKG
ncbi:hypothetical protein F5878DRAFT_664490 [Lentinula raphanica]|uniref:Uncharacterized protein n=1 Tax=Lentinula raphanica TaxID=153919 RepID=A0AA38P1U7_9AGAR|nr:hypothetical protein F5878DRAFT_664490 [Lentinula raphanica]